jgi:hypothetical protein
MALIKATVRHVRIVKAIVFLIMMLVLEREAEYSVFSIQFGVAGDDD